MTEAANHTIRRIVRDAMNLGRHDHATTRAILYSRGGEEVMLGHEESIRRYQLKLEYRIARLIRRHGGKP